MRDNSQRVGEREGELRIVYGFNWSGLLIGCLLELHSLVSSSWSSCFPAQSQKENDKN